MNSEHLEAFISGELDERGRRQVEHALRNDRDLRNSFIQQCQMNAALETLLGADSAAEEADPEENAFNLSVMETIRTEGLGSARDFKKSVLTEIVEERGGITPFRWPDLVKTGLISAVASIGLMLVLQTIIFREGGAKTLEADPVENYSARLEHSNNLVWEQVSLARVREDGWLSNGLLKIKEGEAHIALNSGATILVEGPAQLSIESGNRVFLKSGHLTANVPPPASGFTVNTPRLNAVDIGTRFGVSVEPNGDSEVHVMEGEVKASRSSGLSSVVSLLEGMAVRADERTRSELKPIAYGGDRFFQSIGISEIIQPGLRFDFDESGGALIEDSGATMNYDVNLVGDGELGRSPRRAAGHSGGGLIFQEGEALEVNLARDFRLDAPHSVAFWVKMPPKLGSSKKNQVLQYGRDGLSWNVLCNLESNRGRRGALRVEFGDAYVVGSTEIADGNWHHVAYRHIGGETPDLASNLHLFIDGKLEPVSDFQSGTVSSGSARLLRIGSYNDDGIQGWIDDLVIFQEAVSTTQLQELASSIK
ncbi:MAG: FecR domain-containing protein [Verrucomicrobiales bacterium]|nr:FecR domain-containing protein [Verrucomicrobiales bacterium]